MVPLKYQSNVWRTLEISLINCKINFIQTCSANCFLVTGTLANQVPIFTITATKIYVSVVILST